MLCPTKRSIMTRTGGQWQRRFPVHVATTASVAASPPDKHSCCFSDDASSKLLSTFGDPLIIVMFSGFPRSTDEQGLAVTTKTSSNKRKEVGSDGQYRIAISRELIILLRRD
jgi:hypothetical protein